MSDEWKDEDDEAMADMEDEEVAHKAAELAKLAPAMAVLIRQVYRDAYNGRGHSAELVNRLEDMVNAIVTIEES